MAEAAIQSSPSQEYAIPEQSVQLQIIGGEPEWSEQTHEPPGRLRLVDQSLVDAISLVAGLSDDADRPSTWLSVDELPSIKSKRETWDQESHALLAERRELLNAGEFAAVPYAFSVLATGKKVLAARAKFGENSPEYQRVNAGFRLDSQRHRDEARRRLTWEYFGEVEQPFEAEVDSFVYGDYVFKGMVDNGLSPVGSEAVGTEVLIANRREEYTSAEILKLGQLMLKHASVEFEGRQLTMFTFSQVKNSPQTMLWAHRFDPEQNRRFHEQVGFTKGLITNEVITEFLKRKQTVPGEANPSEREVLDTQALSLEGEGVLDVMESLDAIASEISGKNIFMGEEVAKDFAKDYASIPAEAAARQAQNEDEVENLMTEILRLTEEDTDDWLANSLIDKFVTNMLLDGVANNPEAARDIFGPETAATIKESIQEREQGNTKLADQLLNQARVEAPLATVCTGGSCGLEELDEKEADYKELLEGAKAEDGDTILRDTVRACRCGKKGIIYAYNDKKVKKYCPHCKAFESKVSIASKP